MHAQRAFGPVVVSGMSLTIRRVFRGTCAAVVIAVPVALSAMPAAQAAQATQTAQATQAAASDARGALPAQPLTGWFDGTRANALALAAVDLLNDGASHGLEPRDYGLPALRDAVLAAAERGVPPAAVAPIEAALTTAMTRYLRDLRQGRVTPAALSQRYAALTAQPFDARAALAAALAARDPALLARAVQDAAPAIPQYERLRQALAAQRASIGHAAWSQPLPALPLPPRTRVRSLAPGQPWAGLPVLEARLVALGDLAAADVPANDGPAPAGEARAERLYEGPLLAAVQAFQRRHGLADDGLIGVATRAALEVTPAQRAAQLALALERLRWTPVLQGPRMIVINVPEFVLRAYEVQGTRIAVRAEMKVIVGAALDKRTPLIGEDLRFIEFNPFWNVPYSIASKELVPQLRRNPAAWARDGYEFVGGLGPADPVLSAAKLDAVLAGTLRIRQRPGPRNALGDIKFVFPNREAIYLHHTPSVGLFARARRDFSHGCIRVEDPVALATFALAGLPEWNEERIRTTMAAAEPLTAALPQTVPVLIAYGTALVKDGRVHFFDDVYGHDRALAEALRRRVRPPITVPPSTP